MPRYEYRPGHPVIVIRYRGALSAKFKLRDGSDRRWLAFGAPKSADDANVYVLIVPRLFDVFIPRFFSSFFLLFFRFLSFPPSPLRLRAPLHPPGFFPRPFSVDDV